MTWQPHNKYCWDFWFTYKEQTLHVFYLQANRLDCAYNAERRHNVASVGHAVLTDFGWKEINNQPALSARKGEYWDNISIWTGSIIKKGDRYYQFYTARCFSDPFILTTHERRQPQNIGVAESSNLLTWERIIETPVIPNPGVDSGFDGVSWRDPYVIKSDTDDQFYAFICACPKDAPTDAGGVVAYATSSNLKDWQTSSKQILYKSPEFRYLEVPQVFWRHIPHQNSWRLYLLFSPYWNRFFERRDSRGTYYVRSLPIKDRKQVSYNNIPWVDEPANLLIEGFYGGKFVNPEMKDNPVFFGFQLEDEGGHFVGGISNPQWSTFAEDGIIHLSNSKP